ncbi:MAG: fibronectin type III domain-containing protein [Oscillospiraceae bacterium]
MIKIRSDVIADCSKRIIALLVTVILGFTIFSCTDLNAFAAQTGTVNCDALNVRSGAGTNYSIVSTIYNGTKVNIINTKKDSSGASWYQISFTSGGKTISGYSISNYITVTTNSSIGTSATDANFEKYLTSQGFPDSYKPMLRELHKKYPNWIFKAQKINLDWNTVLKEELVLGRNLVHSGAPASWKSMEKGAYNFEQNYWYGLDGSWVAASKEIIAYYLDPRNFLNDPSIFMFENLSYNPDVHTLSGTQNILLGTFMSGNFTTPDTKKTYNYPKVFIEAAKKSGVSPYHLASRCLIEQGTKGSPQSLGTVPGYKNYFNFFDIGAYATGTLSAVQKGCEYAQGGPKKNETSYNRPWTNQYKSIIGGSIFVGEGYIKKSQDTLYLQKFDVVDGGNGYYYHQYMTSVFAPEVEAKQMKKAYNSKILNSAMEFKIPVYNNMPNALYKKPTSNGDNNNFLKSLAVSGSKLNRTFDKYTMTYYLSAPVATSSVTVKAPALSSQGVVSITGNTNLKVGNNAVKIKVKAPSGVTRTYTINVERKQVTKLSNISKVSSTSSDTSVKLTWSTVKDADGYYVYKYNTKTQKYEKFKTVKSNTFTFTNLAKGTTYKFAVKAYNGKVVSQPIYYSTSTNPATVNFNITSDSKKATVKWSKVTGASGYKIYYKTSKNDSWKLLKTVNNKTTSYTKTGLAKGKTYYFTVKAYRTIGGKTYNGGYVTKSVRIK